MGWPNQGKTSSSFDISIQNEAPMRNLHNSRLLIQGILSRSIELYALMWVANILIISQNIQARV